MKKVCLMAALAALLVTAGVSAKDATAPAASDKAATTAASAAPATTSSGMAMFKTDKERVSYAIGTSIGRRMKSESLEIDTAQVAKGLADAMAGATVLTDDELQQIFAAYQTEMQSKSAERTKAQTEKNKAEGEKFLAENKGKEGVQTLPDGLQYKVLKEGAGESPKADDSVTVNYVGKFLDGTEFDSSYKRGQPVTFPVGGVIPGWTEILQKMKPGSKYEVWIPYVLAYGEMGHPPVIPPCATLHFEVELISIAKDKGEMAPAAVPSEKK